MDYSNHYYNAVAQPYGFPVVHQLPTPGGTDPSASASGGSEGYHSNPSPRVRDNFGTFPPPPRSILTPAQDASFNEFQTYDHYSHQPFPAVKQQTPIQQPLDHTPAITTNHSTGFEQNDYNGQGNGESPSDDDEKAPAQTRRKAQNRAAQRAFRERKERHVKELEAKLAALTQNSANVVEENERLKLQLQKTETENQILLATQAQQQQQQRHASHSPQATVPMRFSPTEFYNEVLNAHDNKTPSHRIVTSVTGERLLAAGATWDYIINHDLYKRGLVDVGDVSEYLKSRAKCDGQGPVFEERDIIAAIEHSVASGNDELL